MVYELLDGNAHELFATGTHHREHPADHLDEKVPAVVFDALTRYGGGTVLRHAAPRGLLGLCI